MFELRIETRKHQTLTLTQNESDYQVINVDGLNPPNAQIYTNVVAGMDGEKYKSSKMDMRNLVLTIKINGDIEANRLNLYRHFGSGKWCKVFFKNGSRDVFIEGYVEAIDCPLFTVDQRMQVSIVCPSPYFKSVDIIYTDISFVTSRFTFPFTIDEDGVVISTLVPNKVTGVMNDGEFETGVEIVMRSLKDGVSTPIIYNADTGEYLSVSTVMNRGDIVRVNTYRNTKSITKIVDGVETNIINNLEYGSTWLQLEPGINNFTYDAGGAQWLEVIFEYRHQYEGV